MTGGVADLFGDYKQDMLFYVEFHHSLPSQMSSIFEIQIAD